MMTVRIDLKHRKMINNVTAEIQIKIIFILKLSLIFAFISNCTCNQVNINKKKLFIKEELDRLQLEKNLVFDIVPTDTCAAHIAKVLLTARFGTEIKGEMPLRVNLYHDSIWIVKGNFPRNDFKWRGGVAYIEIRKVDGKVLKIHHGN